MKAKTIIKSAHTICSAGFGLCAIACVIGAVVVLWEFYSSGWQWPWDRVNQYYISYGGLAVCFVVMRLLEKKGASEQ